jgi:hypothetical protein
VGVGAGVGFGSGQEEALVKAGGVGGSYVGAAVSDEDGGGEVEVEVKGRTEEHAGVGFAVGVVAFVVADAVLGVVGAVVDGSQWGSLCRELGAHPLSEGLEVGFGVEATCDAGLVGDDDELVAEMDGGAGEREDAFDPADVGDAVEIVDLVVDEGLGIRD